MRTANDPPELYDEDGLDLHWYAANGDIEKVKRLLAQGAPINAFDELSWTPLTHAAKKNHVELVNYLLSAGADVNAHEDEKIGDTVLKEIAPNCSFEMAKILIDAGADPTIPGWMRRTALDKSAERKKPEGLKVHELLLKAAKQRNPSWPRLGDFVDRKK